MGARVQMEPLDVAAQSCALQTGNHAIGAQVSFVGYVRDFSDGQAVGGLYLEYFPGMTEKVLLAIEAEARQRWPLQGVEVIHRVGRLEPGEAIVFVAVTSAHRRAAFQACEFIMDYLKTRAPFWKKEDTAAGPLWVEGRDSDQAALLRWQVEG
jgi:molybdopterin synthase catalytic subunit